MKLSIIIPVYNVATYLSRCLDSLLQQEESTQCELILVNDGSTDQSLALCQKYQREYQNITVIDQANAGVGQARNVGLRAANGEYVYFVDPDDYVEPGLLKTIFKQELQVDVLMFGYWDEIEGQKSSAKDKVFNKNETLTRTQFLQQFADLFATEMLYTLWNKLYKRSFLIEQKLSFGQAPMGQDIRFNLEVYEALTSAKIMTEQYYHYILERVGSSTTRYRANRFALKLEELTLLKRFLKTNDIYNEMLINQIRKNILMDSCNHIYLSDLAKNEKEQAIKKIIHHPEIQQLPRAQQDVVVKILLTEKIKTYFCLKSIKKLKNNRKKVAI